MRTASWRRSLEFADLISPMQLRLVGTRSCAIRHRTSEEGEDLVKLMGKSLSADSARERSQKQQKEASRHTAPDARERSLRRWRSG